MAEEQTAQQVKEQHLRVLGPELGPIYHALHNDLTWLQVKWQEYRTLFAHSSERVDLLNETAGLFFKVVQDTLWHDVLLHIARLTDSPQTMGKHNLTLLALSPAISDTAVSETIAKLAQQAQVSASFARDWRNRRLAHRDRSLAVEETAVPLAGASRSHVEAALHDMRAVMKHLHAHYFDAEMRFEDVVTSRNARALVDRLELAQRKSLSRESPTKLTPPPEA